MTSEVAPVYCMNPENDHPKGGRVSESIQNGHRLRQVMRSRGSSNPEEHDTESPTGHGGPVRPWPTVIASGERITAPFLMVFVYVHKTYQTIVATIRLLTPVTSAAHIRGKPKRHSGAPFL